MKYKFWQFRLRSLLLVLFFSALGAGWWSHRTHCLERAEFHRVQGASAALEADEAETRGNVASVLSQIMFDMEQLHQQESYERKLREYEQEPIEERMEAILQEQFSRRIRSGSSNFFDESVPESQRVAAAISSGYLLAPIDGGAVPQFVDPPLPPLPDLPKSTAKTNSPRPPPPQPPPTRTLVASAKQTAWETRAKALRARANFHSEKEERYRTALYRPWMRLREEQPPTVPSAPNE